MRYGRYQLDLVCNGCGYTQIFIGKTEDDCESAAKEFRWVPANDVKGAHICRNCQSIYSSDPDLPLDFGFDKKV